MKKLISTMAIIANLAIISSSYALEIEWQGQSYTSDTGTNKRGLDLVPIRCGQLPVHVYFTFWKTKRNQNTIFIRNPNSAQGSQTPYVFYPVRDLVTGIVHDISFVQRGTCSFDVYAWNPGISKIAPATYQTTCLGKIGDSNFTVYPGMYTGDHPKNSGKFLCTVGIINLN